MNHIPLSVTEPAIVHGFSHANQKDGAILGSLIVPILQNRKLSLREVNLSSVT